MDSKDIIYKRMSGVWIDKQCSTCAHYTRYGRCLNPNNQKDYGVRSFGVNYRDLCGRWEDKKDDQP